MKTQTPLERIFEIREYLHDLSSIQSKKPLTLLLIKLNWLANIELLKQQINKNEKYENVQS